MGGILDGIGQSAGRDGGLSFLLALVIAAVTIVALACLVAIAERIAAPSVARAKARQAEADALIAQAKTERERLRTAAYSADVPVGEVPRRADGEPVALDKR